MYYTVQCTTPVLRTRSVLDRLRLPARSLVTAPGGVKVVFRIVGLNLNRLKINPISAANFVHPIVLPKILQQKTKQILTNLSVATSEVQPRLTKNADEADGIWQRCLRKIISTLIKEAKLI